MPGSAATEGFCILLWLSEAHKSGSSGLISRIIVTDENIGFWGGLKSKPWIWEGSLLNEVAWRPGFLKYMK